METNSTHTYRSFIAEILQDYHLLGYDTYVPNKYIYQKLVSYARMVIRQDSDSRRLFAQSHLFMQVNDFRLCLEPIQGRALGNFISDRQYAISCNTIPDCFTTYTGYALTINTIEPSDKMFIEIRPEQYRAIQVRRYKNPSHIYYWLTNQKLVLPDADYRGVMLYGIFVNPIEIKKLNGTFNPKTDKFLDQLFCCPDYLLSRVKLMIMDDLKVFKSIKKDEVPDMNESNVAAPTASVAP